MFARAQYLSHAKQESCAIRCGHGLPGLESLRSLFDGAIRELFSRLVESPDELRAIRGVVAVEHAARSDAFTADDERVFAAKLLSDLLDRLAHRLRVLFFAEICQRFVTKFCWHNSTPSRF